MSDRIERTVDLAASPDRVWRAITDYQEFGSWFRVAIDRPFAVGETATGRITHAGYEHLGWEALIVAIEPERYFAYRWHPYAVDSGTDYSSEPTTLVEFTLAPIASGTRLTIVESGFDALPPERRDLAFRMNEGGWAAQADNVRDHLAG